MFSFKTSLMMFVVLFSSSFSKIIAAQPAPAMQALVTYNASLPQIAGGCSKQVTSFLLKFCPRPADTLQGVDQLHAKVASLMAQGKELVMYLPWLSL